MGVLGIRDDDTALGRAVNRMDGLEDGVDDALSEG